ncbi:MAG: T9SS type A sorting domain-containing protein [Bacteroidetes bacterium]|nr:T9SS type A sorting domain-containing protein [Bacteroidota bacterium]
MKKILLLLAIVIKVSGVSAQQWVVGQPVNQLILPSALGYAALDGCYPNPSVNWTLNVPSVPGVQFSLVVKSADANSMFVLPGNDTLAIGDSVKISGSNFIFSIYYFSTAAPTQPLDFDLVATGIPTQAGAAYPCNLSMLIFMSNLLLCPDGLSGTIPANCTVLLNSAIEENSSLAGVINWPSEQNNFTLNIDNLKPGTRVSVFSIHGNLIEELTTEIAEVQLDFLDKAPGVYLLRIKHGNNVSSSKFNLQGNRQ